MSLSGLQIPERLAVRRVVGARKLKRETEVPRQLGRVPPFRVKIPFGDSVVPDVAVDADGNVWGTTDTELEARRYTRDGQPLGSVTTNGRPTTETRSVTLVSR